MAIKMNRHLERKNARLATELPQVQDKTLQGLGITREELKKLEHQLVGHVVLPGMRDYEKDRQAEFLTPYSAFPQIIVYCAVFNDVWVCLEWAHHYNWWVTCRSGGHSFAGYSVNSGMIVDLSLLNYVSVDPLLKQARVGPGTQFQQLNAVLDTYRLHVPGGTCPDVAIAGYMQGGGFGPTARMFGMNCDSVIQVSMMLYDGRIVVANAYQNPDLFWAVRGGTGGNFGVLLEIQYQLHDLGSLWGFCLQWDIQYAGAILYKMQQQYTKSGAPASLGYCPVLGVQDKKPMLWMLGLYDGPRAEGMEVLAPLREIGNPIQRFDQEGTYGELDDPLFDILPGVPEGQPMLARSGYVSKRLSLADWEKIAEYFATTPNHFNIAGIEPYGGAINTYPLKNSAFIHRDVYLDYFVFAFVRENNKREDVEWLKGYARLLQPYLSDHIYQNYPVRDLANFRWAYWGDAFNTLLFVKQKYDPHNFFHFEQSISPYPADGDGAIRRSTAPSLFHDPTIVYEPYSKSFLKER